MKDPQAFLTVPTGGKVKVEDDFDDCEVGEEEEGCEAPVDPGGLLEDPQSLEDLTLRTKWNMMPIMDERGKWGIFGDDADYESFRKEDNMYACDHCHFSTKNKSNLKAHRNAKHLGVKYPCDQCDYKASYSNHLRQHKRVKHEGVNFPCEFCLFTTSQKSKLKLHLREKHGTGQDLNQKQVSLSLEALPSNNFHRANITPGPAAVCTSPKTLVLFNNSETLTLIYDECQPGFQISEQNWISSKFEKLAGSTQ